jgi:hypothetical protein
MIGIDADFEDLELLFLCGANESFRPEITPQIFNDDVKPFVL